MAGDGADEDGLAGIVAERAAQRPHGLAERAVGDDDVAPDRVEDLAAMHRLAPALHEQDQQVEVARDEGDLAPVPQQEPARGGQDEVGEPVEHFFLANGRLRQIVYAGRASRLPLARGRLGAMPMGTPAIASFALVASLVALLLVDAGARPLALPLLGTANLFLLYVVVLRERDGELPVCELGSVCVLITALYGSVPVLGYWLGGLQWSPFSDLRLYESAMTPADVAGIAWRYVVYLASFIVAYLAWRGRTLLRPASLPAVDGPTGSAVVLAFVGCSAFFLLVFVRYGISEDLAYASIAVGPVPTWDVLPPLVHFAARAGVALLLVAKLCLLVMLFQRWAELRYRVVLLGWLTLEIVHAVSRMGVRRDVAMLLMVAVLLYHRRVRPLSVWQAVATVMALLYALLLFGFIRQGWGVRVPWSANNEFQVLFANAWDLLGRRDRLDVPWQVYLSDLLRLIPRDIHWLLPFEVLDPSSGTCG